MKIELDQFLYHSFFITINDNRSDLFKKIFNHYGLNNPLPKRFDGFTNNDIASGPYKCSLSHVSIIKMAKALDLPYVCIFEDDAYPHKNIVEKIKKYTANIPSETKILALGYSNIFNYTKLSDDYLKIDSYFCGSHSYIIFKNAYEEYIRYYDSNPRIPSDVILFNCVNGNGVIATIEELFIQYNKQKSMSGCSNYIFNKCVRTGTNCPPEGFEKIENLHLTQD